MTMAPQAILYRILGNDLPPRYTPGQTLANLRFTLEHEEELPGLEKRWLLNRIVDPQVQDELHHTIEAAGQRCDLIPFRMEEYRQAWTDLGATPPECHPWSEEFQQLDALAQARIADYIGRAKNLYLMNNNGARNRALDLGFADAEWVLPWDGGCFLPAWAWPEIQEAMQRSDLRYLCSPMHRLTDLNHLPTATEWDQLPVVEPQLAFARRAAIRFDETLRYGSGPKWQVLQRIGLPGPWQESPGWLPWEVVDTSPAPDAGAWLEAGLVLRLSGEAKDERYVDENALWRLRFASIRRFTRMVDVQGMQEMLCANPFRYWTQLNPTAQPADQAALRAEAAEQVLQLDRLADAWEGMAWLALDAGLNGVSASHRRLLTLLQRHGQEPGSDLETSPSGLAGLVPLMDGLTLLQRQNSFSSEEWLATQQWCERWLARLLQASEVSLQQKAKRAENIWQHLLIMALAAFLGRADICCQVVDNLPGLLAHQVLEPADLLRSEQGIAKANEEQLSHAEAWRRLAKMCDPLGRTLRSKVPSGRDVRSQDQVERMQSLACAARGH